MGPWKSGGHMGIKITWNKICGKCGNQKLRIVKYQPAITQRGATPSLSLIVENIELLPFLLPGFKEVIDFIHVDFHHGNLNLSALEAVIRSQIGKMYLYLYLYLYLYISLSIYLSIYLSLAEGSMINLSLFAWIIMIHHDHLPMLEGSKQKKKNCVQPMARRRGSAPPGRHYHPPRRRALSRFAE